MKFLTNLVKNLIAINNRTIKKTMNTKALRQKILDLAIHGKLVPQDPNDEPASVLLERIRAEKERLIKEGKIKKPKKTKATCDKPPYPFQLPEGWVWTTIGELLINRDGERKPVSSAIRSKQKNKIYDYYGAAGIIDKVDEYLFNERLLLIGEDGANLLSRSKDNAFFADGQYWVNNHAHVLDATDKSILDYVAIMINSMKLDDFITGSAQPKLSQDNLNKIPVMLPPFNEQYRILKEVKHWVSLIDLIECGKDNLIEIIQQVKSKILDLAIHGKLVPQDPNDEPATELLKRINPKAEISWDNPHYQNLPKGWCLTTFKGVFKDISSKPFQILQSQIKIKGKHPVISQSSNFIEGYSNEDVLYKCDTPIIIFGDHTRNVKYVDFDFIVGADGVKIIKPYLDAKYGYYMVLYAASPIVNKGYSRHFSQISKFDYIVPPLQEQHRIVAKIEELFAQLDKIEASL